MDEYYICDARNLTSVVDEQVDLIITSPPYFDIKDYGTENQIGYKQEYDDYLLDMGKVLEQCFSVCKDTGSMWLVVDTLKKDGKFIYLPFDLAKKAEEAGWNLQEIIIWKKDRTLPYAHKGEMRNIFEYVLFFVKSKKYKFYSDKIASLDLKEWWIKFPERYSTVGKSKTDVWEFPIPVQGSWGSSYVRHFCPLPNEMLAEIIELTTDKGDVVFDPFAGSGAVLAEAHKLRRGYIGCDLNPEFREMFLKYLATTHPNDGPVDKRLNDIKKVFGSTIGKLRMLKFPSAVLKIVRASDPDLFASIKGVGVEYLKNTATHVKEKYWTVRYYFITDTDGVQLESALNGIVSKAPFTKYGIKAEIIVTDSLPFQPTFEYIWDGTHKPSFDFVGEKAPFIASDLHLTSKERHLIDNYLLTKELA
jgi:DNA modification methylase